MDTEIHMAKIGKFLHDHEAGPEIYGYKKMKMLLNDLTEFMSLQERIMNGVPQTIVTLHEYRDIKEPKHSDMEKNKQQLDKVVDMEADISNKGLKEEYPRKLSDLAFLPKKNVEYLERMASAVSMDGRTSMEVLEEAYDRAVEDRTIEMGEGKLSFFTGVYNDKQEPLYACFSPNRIATAQKWALTLISSQNGRAGYEKRMNAGTPCKEPSEEQVKEEVQKKSEKTEKSELEKIALLPAKTMNLLYQFAAAEELKEHTALEILREAYDRARREKYVLEQPDMLRFPLFIKSVKQEDLYAICRLNRYSNQQKWALTYIGSMGGSANAVSRPVQVPQPSVKEIPEEKKAGSLPTSLTEFAALPGVTVNHLVEFAGDSFPEGKTAQEILEASYQKAVQDHTLYIENQKASYFTGLYNEKGDPLHAGFVKNRFAQSPEWVLNFIGSDTFNPNLPQEQRRIAPGKQLENFAYLGNWYTVLHQLADMALPEKWDFDSESVKNYYILRQYLCYTFYRLQNENKICISAAGNFAAFNTGLVTRMYEDIYACFVPYEDPEYTTKWRLDGFCVAGERGNGKQLVKYFSPLPQAARYFSDLKDLLYDPERQLIADYNHILIENLDRLPMEFIKQECYNDGLVDKLATQAEHEKNERERKKVCRELAAYINSRPHLVKRLRNRLDDAIDIAKKQVRWNYKTALPLYYPKGDCMSLMLPLCLQEDEKVDVAFVVQLTESGNYQGQTILTLPQAYLDARLLCKPNNEWLSTERAVGLMDLEEMDDIGTMLEY